MTVRIVFLAASLPLAAAACAGSSDAARNTSARDSAGIEIIENTQPGWAAADAWQISDTPTLSMGAAEGDPDHEFYQVRGAVRQSDGTIVVANAGSHQLRFYRPDGSLEAAIGRKGGGPGEFEMLAGLEKLRGDSLLALDMLHRRMSLYTPEGTLVRDIPLQGAGPFVFLTLVGPLGDGTYLATTPGIRLGLEMLNRPLGPARDSLQVFRIDSAGTTTDTIGVFPALAVNVRSVEFGGRSMPMPMPVAFSSATHAATGDGVAYIGFSGSYQIGVYGPEGNLRRLIRKTHEPRVITDADKQRYRERMTREAVNLPSQMRSMMEQMRSVIENPDFAETLPAFGRMLVDTPGNLWVSDSRVDQDDPQTWTVFDPGGRMLGAVTVPAGLSLSEIGTDYVLGYLTDEIGTQHVLLYRLLKPRE
jgi:hypothetical protein